MRFINTRYITTALVISGAGMAYHSLNVRGLFGGETGERVSRVAASTQSLPNLANVPSLANLPNLPELPGIPKGLIPGTGASTEAPAPPIQVYFSPHGGCTDAIVRELNAAQSVVLVQAYSFTSAPVAAALKAAHDRGVDVRIILDKSQRTERYSGLTFLQHAGIPVWIDAAHAIAHNKVICVDGQTTIGGSFNFTTSAEFHNAENLLIIRDVALTQAYMRNWQVHLAHSEQP